MSTPCRFGCREPAVATLATPRGCLCFPDDREQTLCLHHAMRATAPGASLIRYESEADGWVRDILAHRWPAP